MTRARAAYELAIRVCQHSHFRPELALARLELAELLLAHYPAERAVALEQLDIATAELQSMGMQPALGVLSLLCDRLPRMASPFVSSRLPR